jgi:hypothetical protein
MKIIFATIIAVSLVATLVLFFAANRVDHLRRLKGWNGVPFGKTEYSASRRQSRLLRSLCLVLLGTAAVAVYGYFVFG